MKSSKNTDKSVKVSLGQIGDVELWYAEDADRTWMLPVLVYWKRESITGSEHALIIPALSMYSSQFLILNALFSVHDQLSHREDVRSWLLPRHSVPALLSKAPGITFSHHYKWPDSDCPPLPAS